MIRALASEVVFLARMMFVAFPFACCIWMAERDLRARHPLDIPKPKSGHREGRA